jgi:hypothetical protein
MKFEIKTDWQSKTSQEAGWRGDAPQSGIPPNACGAYSAGRPAELAKRDDLFLLSLVHDIAHVDMEAIPPVRVTS